jgi:hypothetical protein
VGDSYERIEERVEQMTAQRNEAAGLLRRVIALMGQHAPLTAVCVVCHRDIIEGAVVARAPGYCLGVQWFAHPECVHLEVPRG